MKTVFSVLGLALGLVAAGSNTAQSQSGGTTGNPANAAGDPDSRSAREAKQAAELDLEQLANMEINVTSASKQEESLLGAPAAIFVLTGEDIRRGGFTTLPEALRMVPGLYVARTNAHNWQVSARGFSDIDNNKMLVLVDGRSVYSPALGTVYWDTLDLPLENIDRIEIIRGPGGALWGANAVNGVINIVTKNSQQTQGVMLSTSESAEEGYSTTFRYGGQFRSKASYSIFGRASYWEPFTTTDKSVPPDLFALPQFGARADWEITRSDALTMEIGGYDGRAGSVFFNTTIPTTYLLKGDDVLIRWKHTISDRSSTETMAYCDWYARYGAPGEERNNCDVEFQHTYGFSPRQTLISGGSLFTTGDNLTPDPAKFVPEQRRTYVFSGFVQYEIKVLQDRLRVLGGTKLEHNDYTGFEYQPQGRVVWTPNKQNAAWASFSRSVRIPTRNDTGLDLTNSLGVIHGEPAFLTVVGNSNLESEHILAYEGGYRAQPVPTLSFDLAVYYNKYNNLIVQSTPVFQQLPSEVLFASQFINGPDAQTHGGELGARWRPLGRWNISAAITETRGSALAMSATPGFLFNFQSRVDLHHRLEFDSGIYHYSSLPLAGNPSNPALPVQGVPTLNRVDAGVSWHRESQWTLSVWGRNLQSNKHIETRDPLVGSEAEEVPRSFAFQLRWQSKAEAKGSR